MSSQSETLTYWQTAKRWRGVKKREGGGVKMPKSDFTACPHPEANDSGKVRKKFQPA